MLRSVAGATWPAKLAVNEIVLAVRCHAYSRLLRMLR
eukprot:COSAG02_NODE_72259_length_187_cov_18.409091_1_plen_36_part_01